MKFRCFIVSAALLLYPAAACGQAGYTFVLTGASFASPSNTWFETGCERTVKIMLDGTLYSREELERMDALVIMQVHDRDVYVSEDLGKGKCWEECASCLETGNYAEGFDFVIKRYMSDCYNLRDDPDSKYYRSQSGKPALIVLCTHWHDARTAYNESVRKLAAKMPTSDSRVTCRIPSRAGRSV